MGGAKQKGWYPLSQVSQTNILESFPGFLQAWHTLHSGHCQPSRLRAVRAVSRQAP